MANSLTLFSGIYPDGFMTLDNTKESNYFGFSLPTLTYKDDNYTFYEINRHRKYPYYIGIEDNNGTTLPSEFHPDNIVMKQMFGVHFFNKEFKIDFKRGIIGCNNIPLYYYSSINSDNRTIIEYSDKNGVRVQLPSVIMFNILNGVNVPVVYVDGKRIYFYSDEKSMTYDSSSDDYKANPYTYTNIKFERRAFTPVPYKKVFDISNTDATNGQYYYAKFNENTFIQVTNEDFPDYDGYENISDIILTPEQFKTDTFYIKNDDNTYTKQIYFNQDKADNHKYYRKIQLYIIDVKYGKYNLTEPTQANPGNSDKEIPMYRKLDEILWWEGITEHGISTIVNYANENGEIIDTLEPNDEKYKVYDKGEYQYIVTDNDETVIEAEDGYTTVNYVVNNRITISNDSNIMSFGSIDDCIGISINTGEDTSNIRNIYLFYYLDKDNPKQYGNKNNYNFLSLEDFNEEEGNVPPSCGGKYPVQKRKWIEGKDSNYPFDWLVEDPYNGGWKFDTKKIPELLTRKGSELNEYPGYLLTLSGNTDNSIKLSTKMYSIFKTILYGNNNDIAGYYEKGAIDRLNNFRFFAVVDYKNSRAVTPLFDPRTIHINRLSKICSTESEFNGINNRTDFIRIRRSPATRKDYFYIWPQKPIKGKSYEDGAVYDILSSPYLTNYPFTIKLGSVEKKTYTTIDEEGNEVQKQMDESAFPFSSTNEFYDFKTNATATIDLSAINNDNKDSFYTVNGYCIEYLKFKDYKRVGEYSYEELYNYPSWHQAITPGTGVSLGQQIYVAWHGDGYKPGASEDQYDSAVCGKTLEPMMEWTSMGQIYHPTFGYPKSIYIATIDEPTEVGHYQEYNLNCTENYVTSEGSVPYPVDNIGFYVINKTELETIKTSLRNSKVFYTDEIVIFTCTARAIKVNPTHPNIFGISMESWQRFLIEDATQLKKYTTNSEYMAILPLGENSPDVTTTFFSNN